jgi:hypothetical protein
LTDSRCGVASGSHSALSWLDISKTEVKSAADCERKGSASGSGQVSAKLPARARLLLL